MITNPFANATTQILREFCEEYIRLAELIILFDKDAWDMIDTAENATKMKMIMGEKTAFSSEKAASIHYMRLRRDLIVRNINDNPAVRQAQSKITAYLKQHSYEVRTLRLSFKDKSLLSPSEIYANYYYLVQKLPGMVLQESYNKKK